jgi:signal transduction histidine kinase/DNA-binding response OmpR family regulator
MDETPPLQYYFMKETSIRLLILDDSEEDRLHLKRSLQNSGLCCEITEFENLKDKEEEIFQSAFDCIFLDYLLPEETGLSILTKFRSRGVTTPIVMVTSYGSDRIAVELMKAGATDYIAKDQINTNSVGKIIAHIQRAAQAEKEREQVVNALKVSQAQLAEAQRIAKIGNWEIDATTNQLHWSHEIYNIFEVDSGKFQPTIKNYLDFIDPGDHPHCQATLMKTLKGETFNMDLMARVPSGIKFINVQGYPLLDKNKQCVKILGTLQDITERKRTEQELLNARKLAESSLSVREVFLANMSHEIRTPMNAVIGFTQLLYETNLTDEQKGFVDAIRFSGDNLLVIINDILDLSKIQSGKMQLENIEFDVMNIVKSNMALFNEKAKNKSLELTYEIEPGVPQFVVGDPVRLNQIITNLINNAIKFTERGLVQLHVGVTGITSDKLTLEFTVGDTGIGIPQSKQSVIFDSFVQASGDTSRKFGGTGLGLSIVKSIVELCEGTISLDSQPGKGSTFKVALPFEKADRKIAEIRNQAAIVDEPLQWLKNISVLVVEDNDVNRLLVKKVLNKASCRIDLVFNGLEGVESVKTGKYDVVLMDIQMPEMDGYTATRIIRSLPSPLCDIPIIAMTAHALSTEVDKCISIGMNDYVSKPFKQEVLFGKIARLLKKRQSGEATRII